MMKTIQIILLILIVIGLGLLFTQKLWVPKLVTYIIEREVGTQKSENYELVLEVAPSLNEDSDSNMDNWNWVMSEVSAQGTQFSYPNPLPTKYITPQAWPPLVEMTAGEFICEEKNNPQNRATGKPTELRTMGGNTYCVTTSTEGAAGSVYTSYEYVTKQGDFLVNVSFTLRAPQCLNYDEPKQSDCTGEQANLNIDALVDKIADSLTMM